MTNRLHNELLKNPYTDLSPEGIIKKWKDVQALVPEREKNLRSEQSKSRSNFKRFCCFLFDFNIFLFLQPMSCFINHSPTRRIKWVRGWRRSCKRS